MGNMILIIESRAGERVEASAGKSFEVQLPESPATGFQWRLENTGAPFCALTADEFDQPQGVGGAGVHRWRFEAKHPGETEIAIALRRSWKLADPPAQTFTLRVTIK